VGLRPQQCPQAFEDREFLSAVHGASTLYRAHPYESEQFYRRELARGRITRGALEDVLAAALPELGPLRVEHFLGNNLIGDNLTPGESLRLCPRLEALGSIRTERALADVLVPLVSAWLDQGMAAGANSLHLDSFWTVFTVSVGRTPSWGFEWAPALRARVAAHERAQRGVHEIVAAEVAECAPHGRSAEYCLETLFVLKGWSGIVHRLESDRALAPLEAPARIALVDWLAALLITQHALEDWFASLHGASRAELSRRPCPVEESRGLSRAHLWQCAYERSFGAALLERLEQATQPPARTEPPRFQALVCMDDREESLRRALERRGSEIETWGAVGFFGIDMNFEALGRARPTRQCPPVVEPSRTLRETALDSEGIVLDRMRRTSTTSAAASLAVYHSSRTLVRGVAISLALGMLGFLPLVLKVMQPARVSRWRRWITTRAFPRPRTRIELGGAEGYSIEEQAKIVFGVLNTCGLTREFASLVAVVAHGSTSSNNPFRQAYGCGACCGNNGAPNARAFAAMANTPQVRALLAQRGLHVPTGTLFVPCLHDTTLDTLDILDRESLPVERRNELDELDSRLTLAARRNARERCERFEPAPRVESDGRLEPLVQHVADRGHDLAQPRPEYGHNRVGACIVGRRDLTRSLSLDRRSFLVSYDPTQDADGSVLASAVLGSVPVAVNIAMDYYFSRVDPDGFGAGSKLPLNITSLLGVITGSKSDLRIGLARQMVELHEPMRALVLLEARAKHIQKLVASHARLQRLVRNGWMQLGRIDPTTRTIELWTGECFEPWRSAWPRAQGLRAPDVFRPHGDSLIGASP
jgi:uncharacterized protein YbcC (UPF0753/DUF2309 family)